MKGSGAGVSTRGVPAKPAPEKCNDARKGLEFYVRATNEWRTRMGAGGSARRRSRLSSPTCPHVRHLAKVWHQRATAARRAYLAWWRYQFAWWRWLPDKFARVGACETGYGKRPGSWTWDSGRYVSAFGIYRPAYAQFAGYTHTPSWDAPGRRTPREQFIVASAIQARFGWGAWGCGGA